MHKPEENHRERSKVGGVGYGHQHHALEAVYQPHRRSLDREAHGAVLSTEAQVDEFGLPKRHPLQAIGIDGPYVKATDAASRQEGWFEVIAGKSLPRQSSGNVFAFAHRLEQKPTERMARFLIEQGVDPTQPTTFLSDGGETVRIAQGNFRYFGEPILDWFHITMRLTVLTKTLKGVEFDETEECNRTKMLAWVAPRKLSSGLTCVP